MKNSTLFCLFAGLIIFTACGPHRPTVAELRAEQRIHDSLALINQQRTLRYTDSLLQVMLPQVDPILARFSFEQDSRYEDHGHYVHRLLRTTSNPSRCFLQPYVSDDFRTTIRSYYYGAKPIRHTRLSLLADSVCYSTGGHLHVFESEGTHEVLTIDDDTEALSLLRFIDGYSASRIRVQLFADHSDRPLCTYYLSDSEKQSLIDTYALSVLMSDIHQLEKQQRQASLEIAKYQKRLLK